MSANDTTAGYLNGKLVAGTGILLTENNNGANETLTIATSSSPTDPSFNSLSVNTGGITNSGALNQNGNATFSGASTTFNNSATFNGTVSLSNQTTISGGVASRAVVTNGTGQLVTDSNVDTTELGYLNGVTSNIQTQLGDRVLEAVS